jgi:hypothetical protein
LPSEAGGELEVLVDVEDHEPDQLRCGGDEKIGYRGCAVEPLTCEHALELDGTPLDRRGEVADGHV